MQLDAAFSRKAVSFDLAYFDWTFADDAHLIAGKMRMPFVRPGQSVLWDNDINPEGLAFTYSPGSLFGSAWGFWVEENVQGGSATAAATSSDTRMYGCSWAIVSISSGNTLIVAASYYDLAAGRGRRPFYNGAANGNSLTSTGGLAYDYEVVGLMAEYNSAVRSTHRFRFRRRLLGCQRLGTAHRLCASEELAVGREL